MNIVKLVRCDPGRGVYNIWRKASFPQLPRVYFQRTFSYILKHLTFSVVRSVCNVHHWLLFCYLDVDSEAENNLSSFIMSHYARNYATHGEMY